MPDKDTWENLLEYLIIKTQSTYSLNWSAAIFFFHIAAVSKNPTEILQDIIK